MTTLHQRLAARLKADLDLPLLSPARVEAAVRGVMEELREPSEAMLTLGGKQVVSLDDDEPDRELARDIWQAMIDAALSPEEVEP